MEQKPNEPTMEEILASIRRIISEDGPPAQAAEPESQPGGEQDAAEDVLELTEVVAEPEPEIEEASGASQEEIDAMMAADDAAGYPEPEPEPEPEPPARDYGMEPQYAMEPAAVRPPELASVAVTPRAAAPREDGDGLLSSDALVASSTAFAGLTQALRPRIEGEMHVASPTTLDELMRDLLRPLLKEWLDAHLPGVVERVVQREVERIARRALEQ